MATLNVFADDERSYQLPYAQFLYAELIPNPALLLTSKEVGTLLRYDDSNPTNRHFFRYVFLDGCNTANGSFPTRETLNKGIFD